MQIIFIKLLKTINVHKWLLLFLLFNINLKRYTRNCLQIIDVWLENLKPCVNKRYYQIGIATLNHL